MGMNSQLQALAALPPGKILLYLLENDAAGPHQPVWTLLRNENCRYLAMIYQFIKP